MNGKRIGWFFALLFLFLTASPVLAQNLSVDDVSVTEGNSGTATAIFTVTLSAVSGMDAEVTAATANNTATGGSACGSGIDYVSKNETLTFSPGETSKSFTVTACGDTDPEENETFLVNLTNAVNATIADGQGQGTVLNDEPAVSINIEDVLNNEGDSGTTLFSFLVKLSTGITQTVKVDYATAQTPSTAATSGVDFIAASGTLSFSPEVIYQYVEVQVIGDKTKEGDEAFYVNLSNPVNAIIADGQGLGIIMDEESRTAIPTLSEWGMIILILVLGAVAFWKLRPFPFHASALLFLLLSHASSVSAQTLAVDDVTVAEGNAGTVNAVFTVTLSAVVGDEVMVDYATADGTAAGGAACQAVVDYITATDTLTFFPGETAKNITITVCGDAVSETNETFFVNLSNAMNAGIADGQGLGTITDDDAPESAMLFSIGMDGGMRYTILDIGGKSGLNVSLARPPFSGNTGNPFVGASEGTLDDGWTDPATFSQAAENEGMWIRIPWEGRFAGKPAVISVGGDNTDLLVFALGLDNRIWYTYLDFDGDSAANAIITEAPFANNADHLLNQITEGPLDDGWTIEPAGWPIDAGNAGLWLPVPGEGEFIAGPTLVKTAVNGDLLIFALGKDSRIWYTYFDLNGSSGLNAIMAEAPFSTNAANSFASATEGTLDDGWADPGTFLANAGNIGVWVSAPDGGNFLSSPALLQADAGSKDLLLMARGLDSRVWYTYFDLDGDQDANEGPFGSPGQASAFSTTSGTEGPSNDGWPDGGTFPVEAGNVGPWVPIPGEGSTIAMPHLLTLGGDVLIFILGEDGRFWYTIFDENGSAEVGAIIPQAPFTDNTQNPLLTASEGPLDDNWVDGGTFLTGAGSTGLWVPFPASGSFKSGLITVPIAGNNTDILLFALGLDDRVWYTYFDLDGDAGANAAITEAPFSQNTDNPFVLYCTEGPIDDGFPDTSSFPKETNPVGIWLPTPGDTTFQGMSIR